MWAEKCARLEAELEAQRKALEERRAEMERLRKEAQEQEVCLDFMFKGSSTLVYKQSTVRLEHSQAVI